MAFGQVALSVADFRRTLDFYCDLLGFARAGWTDQFEGEVIAKGLGLPVPTANIDVGWIVDRQEFFNIEVIQFLDPPMRPRADDSRASDIGYSLVFVHLADFDGTIRKLTDAGVEAPVRGEAGDRRATITDPEGVLLELWERDVRVEGAPEQPRPEINAAVRGVRVSVPDLTRSRSFFVDVLGLRESDVVLHGPDDEASWGLPGAKRELMTVTGGDYFVELVQYADPAPAPWRASHSLADQGILNIALGSRERGPFEATRAAVAATDGTRLQLELPISEVAAVNYVDDPDGFSVELIYMEESVDKDFGLVPID
jgi:catechol 2,3-dioxygenase-like lactoylglutathione lyase family enzyme